VPCSLMPQAKTRRYKFLLARSASSPFVPIGEHRALDDGAAKVRALKEVRNENAREALQPAARIIIRRADDTLVCDLDCGEFLQRNDL